MSTSARHRTLAATGEALDDPRRRRRLRVHVADDAAGEATAQVGRLDAALAVCRHARTGDCAQPPACFSGAPVNAGDLTRNAVHAQAVREIGRQLQREQHVVELQLLADVDAHGRVVGQHQQARVIVRELQLARRAQHALALDATQLAELDAQRLAALLDRRQLGADQRARHLHARHARSARRRRC